MRRFSIIEMITFIGLFIAAILATSSVPLESETFRCCFSNGLRSKVPQEQIHHGYLPSLSGGASNNNHPGKLNNDGSGGGDDDVNGIPQCPKYPKVESVQETENRVDSIDEYLLRMEESSDSENEQCEIGERITSVVSKDGSRTKVSSIQVRDKGKHIPEFLDKKGLKGVFDANKLKGLTYEERLEYLRNKDNLSDDLVFEAQDKIGELLSAADTYLAPGFLGSQKIRGTVFINVRLNQFGFRDKASNEYRTGGYISDNKIREVAKSDFHLFPTSRAND